MTSTRPPLVGSVFERKPSASSSSFAPLSTETRKTGFPPVKHRSAFIRSREQTQARSLHVPVVQSSPKVDAGDAEPRLGEASKLKQETEPAESEVYSAEPESTDDLFEEISRENAAKVAAMSPEEREAERREILEQFGEGIGEVLRRAREKRTQLPDAVPVSTDVSKAQTSPPRPSLSRSLSRPTTPRSVRFAQLAPTDVHVYESAPSSPRKKVLMLPPSDGSSDVISLKSSQPLPDQAKEEGTPEDIRQRFFPDAPSNNPDIEWMMDSSSTSSDPSSSAIRFDLSGKPLDPSVSLSLPTHLGLHHHAEGTHAGYTLDDIFLLSRSSVNAQRSAMLGILKGVITFLREGNTDLDAPKIMKQILFVGLEALGEPGVLGARAVELVWGVIVSDGAEVDLDDEFRFGGTEMPPSPLMEALPLEDLLPQIAKVLGFAENDGSATTTEKQLLSLLHYLARHSNNIAEQIVQTPGLLSTVVNLFLYSSNPDPHAIDFLITTAMASRSSAKFLVDAGLASGLLRFVASIQQPLLQQTLRLYVVLARYGLASGLSGSAIDVWRKVQAYLVTPALTETWATLLETWTICAIDPHRTTPPHSLLWSRVWWGEDLMALVQSNKEAEFDVQSLYMQSSLWAALAAWLEGCRVNSVRAGEKECNDCLPLLPPMIRIEVIIDGLAGQLEPNSSNKEAASYATALMAIIRLWLACLPPQPLPFDKISHLCARFVTHQSGSSFSSAVSRPFSSLLFYYLQLSKHHTSQDLWMSQVFAVIPCLQPGDESLAIGLIGELVNVISHRWAEVHGISAPNEVWEKGGVGIIRPFLVDVVNGQTRPLSDDEELARDVIAPLVCTSRSIAETTTQRRLLDKHGLPLKRNWTMSPLDRLLKLSDALETRQEILVPSPWAASETDIVRATMLFTKIGIQALRGLKSFPTLTREELVFDCMKVFMLEHGIQNDTGGEEVFRDGFVAGLMKELLAPFSVSSSPPSTSSDDLEKAATSYLGASTPFYQFFTDFVALYDGISFSHPVFSLLLLPPLSMRYAVDYRKLIFNDYAHLLKNIRTPVEQLLTGDLTEYLSPIEKDPQMIAAYLRAVVRDGSALGDAVKFIAMHHLAANIWRDLAGDEWDKEKAGKLLGAVVSQAGPDIVREVVRYHQAKPVLVPPRCYEEGSVDVKVGRWALVKEIDLQDRLKGLFE
ncbi:hypothetical protein C8J56DRAFT_911181 [Mycena floridula]|nr:hypothetical protein C8J56DRAFT_911181 [Mycena floridula]